MNEEFDSERFDLLNVQSVHVENHAYGHNEHGDLHVWKSRGETGTAFVRQITVDGVVGPSRQSVNGTACYFLRDKASGQYFFLERDDRGYFLHDAAFFGASTYLGPRAAKVATWLAAQAPAPSPGPRIGVVA